MKDLVGLRVEVVAEGSCVKQGAMMLVPAKGNQHHASGKHSCVEIFFY